MTGLGAVVRAGPPQAWDLHRAGSDRGGTHRRRCGSRVSRSRRAATARNGSRYRIGLNGLQAQTVGASGRVLALFLGAAGLLLVLAAMNAATLLLARSLERTKEFGIRMALGAGRMRIIRLILSEAGILAVAGGAIGVLLAYGGVAAFLRYAPASIPRLNAVALDGRALALAIAISLGTGHRGRALAGDSPDAARTLGTPAEGGAFVRRADFAPAHRAGGRADVAGDCPARWSGPAVQLVRPNADARSGVRWRPAASR